MLSYTVHHLRQQTLLTETPVPMVPNWNCTLDPHDSKSRWLWAPTAITEPQSVNKQAIWWPYFSVAQVIRAALKDVPVNNEVQTSALKPTQTLRHRATDWILDGMLLIADRGITSTG